jgi:hypothetical protein
MWSVASQSSISPLRRVRHQVCTQVFEHSAIYLPFARHKYRGHSPEVISSRTELVIDCYFRSANTFAVHAFQLSQLPALERLPQASEFRRGWIPPEDRARLRAALGERLLETGMAQHRDRAQSVYRRVLAAAALTAAPS